MHVTFDLSEIEETILQQARKQLETELETTLHSFGDVCCLYTAVMVSPVQSIVQSRVQLLQSPRLPWSPHVPVHGCTLASKAPLSVHDI